MAQEMRSLLLIRHAQGSLGTDDYDRLSPTGLLQAEVLAEHLRHRQSGLFDDCHVLRGDLRRHRQTAEAIADSASIEIDADLNEYRVDGLLAAAFAEADQLNIRPPTSAALADPRAYLDTFLALFPAVLAAWQERRLECMLNGQWQAFHARVQRASERLRARMDSSAAPVIAVTSAGVISTLVADLLNHDLAWQRALNVALYNASITELALDEGGRWNPLRINCIAHLPQPDLQTLA